jgi:hypothetical protein
VVRVNPFYQEWERRLTSAISPPIPLPKTCILKDHVDDFFPSPGREIQELRDDVDDLHPVTASKQGFSIQQELAFLEDHLDDFFEDSDDMSTDTQVAREF